MAKICMNLVCQAKTTHEWKKGWGLKSGGFATLCYNCGFAYENLIYCETFHLEETGWRECRFCGKRIHCGCIASKYLHDYLDFGGVGCVTCAKSSIRPIQILGDDIPSGFGTLTTNDICDPQSSVVENKINGISVDKRRVMQLRTTAEVNETSHFHQTRNGDSNGSLLQRKREDIICPIGEASQGFPNLTEHSVGSSIFAKPDNNILMQGVQDMYDSLTQPSLSFSLSPPLGTPNYALPFPGGVVEGREQNKLPPFQQGQRTRHILPKPPKSALTIGLEANKEMVSQVRTARPPAEGRGRNQLLPRYWPRITDKELQQLSGDLNSTIVPLFEKVLSASDAGRIGRLVLPKACAEAYFPPIYQSEGLPVRIQDIKGKEWMFQFRFWPNNNSRMYVLEGVTPCIQNMQLQAGDTVTFSRIDPGGKLVMGFRKAENPVDVQDGQVSALPNGAPSGEASFSGVNGNLITNGGRTNDDSLQQSILIPEKKKTRNIGLKSKRLLMHSEDAMELRLTWEEAQELLRPPPSAKPTVVMIDDHEFEEYDEPPVFGKRTIFTTRASGKQEQWAQCDSCSKWRKLPVDVLLPSKWTCSENIWDPSRCSCSAPDDMSPKDLESFFKVGKDFKNQRTIKSHNVAQEHEPSGLDTLATAAVLGDDVGELIVGATTKHPRHRPGCACIVCIQPPSGKGKHKPNCICNVCMTVKRRFKTLTLRRKKRQSEHEAEIARGKDQILVPPRDESEMAGTSVHPLPRINHSDNERSDHEGRIQSEVAETSKEQLDLNCHPNREDELLTEATGVSMTSLVHAASLPLEMYLRQNGLLSLRPCLLSQSAGENEGSPPPPDEGCLASLVLEHENMGGEG